jgi:hypothetical protein
MGYVMKKKIRTKEEFMLRFRSTQRHHLTAALNMLTPGINWSGCSKGHIAEAWAKSNPLDLDVWTKLGKVELDALEQEVRKIEAGK